MFTQDCLVMDICFKVLEKSWKSIDQNGFEPSINADVHVC